MGLTTHEGWHIAFEGEEIVDNKSLAAELYRGLDHEISNFWIKDGVLALSVRDAHIHAVPHPHYESWNVVGPDHELVVCVPGGEMAIWDPAPEAPKIRRHAEASTLRRTPSSLSADKARASALVVPRRLVRSCG